MKRARQFSTIIVLALLSAPLSAADDDSKAFGQFQLILVGLNDRSFDPIKRAIDRNDITRRIYGIRLVDSQVRKIFSDNFWQIMEAEFFQSMSISSNDDESDLVAFRFESGKGRAVVRADLRNYQYGYLSFELRHDTRGRLKIVDWFSYNYGIAFSENVSEALVSLMPNRNSTRELLSVQNATDRQLFQVTEILKAARDNAPPRFFEIYDDLDEPLRNERLIAKFALQMAILMRDKDRHQATSKIFASVFGEDLNYALPLADLFLAEGRYEEAYSSLESFYEHFLIQEGADIQEGATPARLSALALALGKTEAAEKYAVTATTAEPGLELGWWSLLRANCAAEDFTSAILTLTHLEDDFGHRLDEAKLRKDRFRSFRKLAVSQEFRDWRASRD